MKLLLLATLFTLGGKVSNSSDSTSDTTLIVYFDKNKRVTNHNFRTEMY